MYSFSGAWGSRGTLALAAVGKALGKRRLQPSAALPATDKPPITAHNCS